MLRQIGRLGWKLDFTRKGYEYTFRLTHLEINKKEVVDCKLKFHENEIEAKYNKTTKTFTFEEFLLDIHTDTRISSLKCPKDASIRLEAYTEDMLEFSKNRKSKS